MAQLPHSQEHTVVRGAAMAFRAHGNRDRQNDDIFRTDWYILREI